MRTPDQHLSSEEISCAAEKSERLLSSRAEGHLETCEECRDLVDSRRITAELSDLIGRTSDASRLDGCPSPETWLNFLNGTMVLEARDGILVHASECCPCGQILAELLESEDREGAEAGEPSSEVRWRRLLAERIAAPSQVPKGFPIIPQQRTVKRIKLVWPVAAMVVLGAGSAILVRQNGRPERRQPPFDLLAKAFASERPNDLRFPSASYAPVRVNRGSGSRSNMDEPPALLESEAEIARELQVHPDDPDWLEAKARTELFRGNSGAARKSLERALDSRPGSIAMERDMASAWFEAGDQGGGSADFGRAAELFSEVLRKSPRDPVALFNRAVTYERMSLFRQAKSDWQKYLEVEPRGGWSDEARRHLTELNVKLSGVALRSGIPLEPGDPQVMEMLHSGYGTAPTPDTVRKKARSDLARLATEFEVEYQDSWLRQFLGKSQLGSVAPSVETLYRAFEINLMGDPSSSASEASRALRLFEAAGNPAGSMRARFELAYGLQLSAQGKKCLAEAKKLSDSLKGTHFAWLQAQAHLELSAGLAMEGDFHQAIREAGVARTECELHGFETLRLRGLGFQAGDLDEIGRWRAAWDIENAGLSQFWSGHFPPYRAYQFYDSLSIYAERRGLVELARALAKEGVFMITGTGNDLTEAMERYKVARMALAAGDVSEANEEFVLSNTLFDSLPSSSTISIYRAYGEIWLARTQVKQGKSSAALNLLSRLEPVLATIDNKVVRALLYSTLAEAQQHLGNKVESERALQQVVGYGERTLRLLHSDEERLNWAREMDDAYRGLIRTTLDRGDQERALAIWEWFRAAGQPADRRPSDIQTVVGHLQKVRLDLSHSRHRTTIISFAQMDSALAAWTIDERGTMFKWLPVAKEDVERYARYFAEACSNEETSLVQTDRLGKVIYERILAPLGIALTGDRTILIEGDGATSLIPFEAVKLPNGVYLGDVCRFIASPGVLYSQEGRGSRSATDTRRFHVLAVGNPKLALQISQQYPSLPDAVAEAEMAASLMPNGVVLTDKHATVSSIRQSFAQVAIFHFAGHALASPEHSGLLVASEPGDNLGRTGFWDASSLEGSALSTCALVVLSACSTGQYDGDRITDANNLVRAFLNAGAHGVIASRWPVDSKATRELMSYFYGEVSDGATPAIALSSASRRLRKRSDTVHPRFWAAFCLFAPDEEEIPFFKHRNLNMEKQN